jgi:hypothetical protein
MMLVATAFGFLASRWVSLVGQFSITMYGYVTASAQLFAYRAFARAGGSLDKIISLTHCPFLGLISRQTETLPSILIACRNGGTELPARAAVFDGELVFAGADGRPRFYELRTFTS